MIVDWRTNIVKMAPVRGPNNIDGPVYLPLTFICFKTTLRLLNMAFDAILREPDAWARLYKKTCIYISLKTDFCRHLGLCNENKEPRLIQQEIVQGIDF